MASEKKVLPASNMTHPPLPAYTEADCRWRNYLFLDILGEGVYGKVRRGLKMDSTEMVAVKILKDRQNSGNERELFILQRLRCLDPDKFNIVKFYESYQMFDYTCLVFEFLDVNLFGYMNQREFQPLPLEEIRGITEQMAVAFDGLKSVGVIHADLKPDNIMVVDRLKKPLRVKLVDFGLSLLTSEAKQGITLQALAWRSPEILLGLPFSEAIDMWSLGCLMSYLFLGFALFLGMSEYEMICSIVQILGQPQDHLLTAGQKTRMFFNEIPRWSLMTSEEHAGDADVNTKGLLKLCKFSSLDELKELGPRERRETEADERRKFVHLLKEMFQMDARERITPSEVLNHPFITKGNFIEDFHHSSQTGENAACSMQHAAYASQGTHHAPQPTIILVRPYVPIDDIQTEEAAERQPDSQHVRSQAFANSTSSCQKDVDEGETAKTEATPSQNTTNAEVDSGVVVTSVLPADTEQTHTTPEVSEPKKKQKKKKNKVRRFFSRLFRTICGCCTKCKDVE